MTLTEFLLARIEADETAARHAVRPGLAGEWESDGGAVGIMHDRYDMFAETIVYNEGTPSLEEATHIARWDPNRVLAECEAKRRIVKKHTHEYSPHLRCGELLLLASVYADHPDFQPEWMIDR